MLILASLSLCVAACFIADGEVERAPVVGKTEKEAAESGLAIRAKGISWSHIAQRNEWQASDFFLDRESIAAGDAILSGDLESLRSLLKDWDGVNTRGRNEMTLVYWAYMCDDLKAYEMLLEHGASPDIALEPGLDLVADTFLYTRDTVLHTAARRNCEDFLISGLRYTKAPSVKGAGGDCLLLIEAGVWTSLDVYEALIQAGADLAVVDKGGNTALVNVIIGEEYDAAIALLHAGADPRGRENGMDRFNLALDNRFRSEESATRVAKLHEIRRLAEQRLVEDP